MGRTSYMIFPSHGSTSRRLTGETNSSSTTLHMDTCSWKLTGEANSTTPHVDILWLTGKVMKNTLLDTRPHEVDWGGHDPNGPDNPPPISIINLDDLLGRTFLLPMDENGERKRATISEHVKDLCQQQVSREDQHRFNLKIDGDQLDDLISYNQLMEYLEDKTDTGPLEDGFYRFKCIKDHEGPYTSSEVDLGGHDPNPNHVNESLLSEVDWGAHNPDADDPEQLTGESIQSFLTFEWLVTLGRLVTHAQVTTLSKLVVASS